LPSKCKTQLDSIPSTRGKKRNQNYKKNYIYIYIYIYKNTHRTAGHVWSNLPVIPATWEAEAGGLQFKASLDKRLSENKTKTKSQRTRGMAGLSGGALKLEVLSSIPNMLGGDARHIAI
jgi:hypothetical protein